MTSTSYKRRKGKEPMVAEALTFDTTRFKSQLNETRYHGKIKQKKILPEAGFKLGKGEYPNIKKVVKERGWELLCDPLTDISAVMIREFYANAMRDREDSPGYKSYVRGTEGDFSPSTIKRVLKLKSRTYKERSFEERMEGENDPDELSQGLCLEGRDWERDSKGDPSHFRRLDLIPEARGWREIVRRSVFPTSNTSGCTIKRAILIFCILKGGEINIPKIIADSIQEIADDAFRGVLAHPSTIQRLCDAAGVSFEDEDDEKVGVAKGISKQTMEGVGDCDDDQGEGRPQRRRRRRPQGEEESNTMDMSGIQEAIEELSQQYSRGQEKQEDFQTRMLDNQREFQARFLDQQREFHNQSMDLWREQGAQMQGYFEEMLQKQSDNLLASKECTTLVNARYSTQADYNISSQIKLNYIGEHLQNMDAAFPTFDEFFKQRKDREIEKAILLEKRVEETMKQSFWDKLKGKGKGKGEGSKQKEIRSKKRQDPKDQGNA